MSKSPHILFTCGREPEYTRNDVVLRALRSRYNLTEVTDRHGRSLTARILRLIPRLIQELRRPHDLIFVGFYGHPLAWLARRFSDRPMIFDAFVSTHDTLTNDRQKIRPGSLGARLAKIIDQGASRAADRVLMDTVAHSEYYSSVCNVPRERVHAVYVGCNEDMFHLGVVPDQRDDGYFRVLYYGTYQPLHGMETVISAARLLATEYDIQLRIIGFGQEYALTRSRADEWGLKNVLFEKPIPYESLPDAIASADLCLGGPFGCTGKARRVITGKTFQFLAMGKPIVVGDTPANRELLTPGRTAAFVPLADPSQLANVIRFLRDDHNLRNRIAAAGHACYKELASEAVIGQQLITIVEDLLGETLPG